MSILCCRICDRRSDRNYLKQPRSTGRAPLGLSSESWFRLVRPALGTLAALAFVWTWGELIVAVVVVGTDPSRFTMVLAANTLVGQTLTAGGTFDTTQTVAAATLISLLPMLCAVYVAQRAIVRGFGAGGVK